MLLNKLESGFLRVETPQGSVALEPSSFWERVYLLWTFRNFRQLVLPLLNPRQIALINKLFLEHETVVAREYDPKLEIGLVENFEPPAGAEIGFVERFAPAAEMDDVPEVEMGAATAMKAWAAPVARIDAAPAMEAKLAEPAAGQDAAPVVVPIGASTAIRFDELHVAKADAVPEMIAKLLEEGAEPTVTPVVVPIGASTAMNFDELRAAKEETGEEESTAIDCEEIAPRNDPVPEIVAERFIRSNASWLRLTSPSLRRNKLVVPRRAMFGFAAATGALLLCVCSVFAWHRIAGGSDSQAHNSRPQRNLPDSPSVPTPPSAAANPATAPEAPDQPPADPEAAEKTAPDVTADPVDDPTVKPGPEAPGDAVDDPTMKPAREVPGDAVDDAVARVKPSPAKVAPPITATRPMMTPERESRGATARVARSNGGPHSAALTRVRASTSGRRLMLAPGSRGVMAGSAQSYFDLAKRQMRMGNYSAATANYQRAWQIEEISAAAKGRQTRARRAMQQAKNEMIAKRR
jgi:hypothetical protein